MHSHKPETVREIGWKQCCTPAECAENPRREHAHGWITSIATCRCGAVRESEWNGSAINHGPWKGGRKPR